MPTDLDLYSIFCTVARCGSLSHAARELYVSQPAISQSMHRLEYTLAPCSPAPAAAYRSPAKEGCCTAMPIRP